MSKLKVDELRSADRSVSDSANITLADDGNTSLGGTLSAGTIGGSVNFPAGSTGSFGGHILQMEHGLYQCTNDIAIDTNSTAYGPVISMVMKTANAKIYAMVCHGETSCSLGAQTFSARIVYKSSSFSAAQGNTGHGATVVGDPAVNQTKIREHSSSSFTYVASGTISNSAGDTIYFSPEGVVSGGSNNCNINNGGPYTNISIHLFEMS